MYDVQEVESLVPELCSIVDRVLVQFPECL